MKDFNKPFKSLALPVKEHKPSLPSPKATPRPEVQKVAASEGRAPINRQARLIIAPVKCWTHQPIPVAEPVKEPPEVAELRAQLKIERNAHAETRDSLGQRRNEIRALKEEIASLSAQLVRLREIKAVQDDIIRQLENIKL